MQKDAQGQPTNLIGLDGVDLDRVLKMADGNTGEFAQRFPLVWDLLGRTHAAYAQLWRITEHDDREDRLLPRMFITRGHAGFCAAIRLATGGQFSETFPIIRVAIENAWYALHIAMDPNGTSRARIWLCRNDDAQALKACKAEFTVARVRATHEQHDSATARQMHALYETMIDYGGHPNMRGMLTGFDCVDSPGITTFLTPLLSVEALPMVLATRMAVAVAIGSFHIHRLIYPERVQISGFRKEIDELGDGLNSVYKPFIASSPTG